MKDDRPTTDLMARTLWQVENDLARAPRLDDLAAALGVSRFHLTRGFALRTGQSLMAYVRARRLSEAARNLARPGARVTAVGLDAGYDSAEGFARAFRSHFGLSPSSFRNRADLSALTLQEPFEMATTPTRVRPKIQTFAGATLCGRSRRFTAESRPRIPAFWDVMAQEHPDLLRRPRTFGVCSAFAEDGSFDYLIGVEDRAQPEAEGLQRVTVPAGRYAVFDHAGHVATIGDTWEGIFAVWAVEQTGWKIADGPEFELYAPDFDPSKPGGVAVWIPVREV